MAVMISNNANHRSVLNQVIFCPISSMYYQLDSDFLHN
jgi:hypothetical protein